ncbi:MAG: biliverdin-producing heme oxygenase [Gallionellaceae bacterium]
MNNVLARLRSATHPMHVRLNHHPRLLGLLKKDLQLASYIAVLATYLPLYKKLEKQILQFASQHSLPFDYSTRVKQHWLQEDLDYLKVDPKNYLPDSAIEIQEIKSVGEWVGLLYPIEGSTLGGQVILKHVQSNLGLTREGGARFFSGYGQNTPLLWNEFGQFANSILRDETECKLAEITAIKLFEKFEEALNEHV